LLSYDNYLFDFHNNFDYTYQYSAGSDEQKYDILPSMPMATKVEIEQFLNEFKKVWKGFVIPRPENENTLLKLGTTPYQRANEVRNLTYKNYFRGPTPEHTGNPGEWWEFGKMVKGEEIYIKLQIFETKTKRKKKGKCLSFHISDRLIKYPF
jgi:hypothetical protein